MRKNEKLPNSNIPRSVLSLQSTVLSISKGISWVYLRSNEGLSKVQRNTAAIGICEESARASTLSHELGHVFGIRGPDDAFWTKPAWNWGTDLVVNQMNRTLRYLSPWLLNVEFPYMVNYLRENAKQWSE